MKQQKSWIGGLLTATLFYSYPMLLNAFQNLGPAQNGSDSSVFPAFTGYNFVASNVTFTLVNNELIGTTAGVSLDNNSPNSGIPFSNDVLQFVGNVVILGDVGTSNPIPLMLFNTGNIVNNQVRIRGDVYNATTSHIVGIGGTTIFLDTGGLAVLNSNFTTNNNNLDTMILDNINIINGFIGSPNHTFATIFVDRAQFNKDVFANHYIFTTPTGIMLFADNVSPHGPITTQAGNGTGEVRFAGSADINFPIGSPGAAVESVGFFGEQGTINNLNANIIADLVFAENFATVAVLDSPTITTSTILGTVFEENSTLSLANQALLNVVGNINLQDTSTLVVDMGGNLSTTGEVVATGNANTDPGVKVTILRPGFSPGKTTLIPILDGVGGTLLGGTITNPNNFLTTFATVLDNVNDTLFISITSNPLTNFANGNTQGVAAALDAIALGPPIPGLDAILAQLASFTDPTELNEALATLTPIVDGAILYESFNTQRQIFGTVGDRLDRVNFWRHHLPPVKGGVNAGGLCDADLGIWIEVFKAHANQKERQEIAGYKDDTWGIIVGADRMITPNSILGFSLSWSSLDINNDVSNSKTNANAYQATLYTDIDFNCPLYFKGELGVAYNHYKTARNIIFGDLSFFANGRFHGIQTGAKGEMGYIFGRFNFQAIPLVSFFYSNLDLRSYQETGAGALDLLVNGEYFNTLLLGVGGKLIDDYAMSRYFLLQSEVHAMAFYDLFNNGMQLTSQFTGSGPSFKTQGFAPARDSYDLGVGLTLFSHYSFNLTGVYDFNFKNSYKAHSGFFRLRYEFA